jgi:hypothetical protein
MYCNGIFLQNTYFHFVETGVGDICYNISETGSISVIRHTEVQDPTQMGPLETASLDY